MNPTSERRLALYLNLGHTLDHLFMLIFPTVVLALGREWNRPYSRELGAYPLRSVRASKYFPPVSRIDSAYGDRNLMCSCEPLEAYTNA